MSSPNRFRAYLPRFAPCFCLLLGLAATPAATCAPATDEPTEKVKELVDILKRGSTNDRVAASRQLAELGDEALPAVPWLVKLVGMDKPTPLELLSRRPDPARVAAARAIAKLDRSKLVPALQLAR